MPRSGPPRGADGPARRAPLPHGIATGTHLGMRRAPFALRLVPPERTTSVLRRPTRPPRVARARPSPLTDSAAVADALAERAAVAARGTHPAPAIPLGGPTAEERARHLRAAYDASANDAGQRQLISEIMAHFRAWCEAHALGDPFASV